jgi:serine-type D-Ala-D-Ala carboxypeptidase/endopeptidase (penicillin-binding protein 4)
VKSISLRLPRQGYKFILIALYLLLQFPSRSPAQNSGNYREISPDKEQICQENLSKKIEGIITRSEWAKSHWGIAIETVKSKRILYRSNDDRYFVPASNTKLLSSAVALLKLGDNFRIKTSFYLTGAEVNPASLRVVGRGDPTLTLASLKSVAQQLKERGIEKIGELIIDDSYLSDVAINNSWEWGDIYFDYGVSPRSFILEENTVKLTILPQSIGKPVKLIWSDDIAGKQWRVKNTAKTAEKGKPYNISVRANLGNSVLEISGELPTDSDPDEWGLAIPNPSQYFLISLSKILDEAGIKVDRTKILKNTPQIQPNEVEITSLQSPSLAELLIKVNSDSNNLVAETLLEILAKETQQDKLEVLQNTLTELGIDPAGYNLNDASGLSRQNLISPKTFIEILRLLHDNKIYHQSLSVAGTNGTLKKRFLGSEIKGFLYAKTGTLIGTSALSGYLEIPEYEPIVFSIILNNSTADSIKMREAIDRIILLVARDISCAYEE